MIEGIVNANDEPIIPLRVRNTAGTEEVFEAVVDTGFNEYLTLPPDLITKLNLPFSHTVDVMFADGSVAVVAVYSAIVEWDGVERLIPAQAEDITPLVGMALLRGYNLSVDAVVGGAVRIAPL